MKEIWKHWKTTKNCRWGTRKYEISNFGRVKVNGEIVDKYSNKKIYVQICHCYLHRIVAELFVPNPNNKNEIDHIDGNISNNNADNLRWCTHEENVNNPITLKRMKDSASKIETKLKHKNVQNKLWSTNEYREKCCNGQKKRFEDPNERNKSSINAKKQWENDEYRNKMIEVAKRNHNTLGRKRYNNGKKEICIIPGTQPPDFVEGALSKIKIIENEEISQLSNRSSLCSSHDNFIDDF